MKIKSEKICNKLFTHNITMYEIIVEALFEYTLDGHLQYLKE